MLNKSKKNETNFKKKTESILNKIRGKSIISRVKKPKIGNWKIGSDIFSIVLKYFKYFKINKPITETPKNIKSDTTKDQGAGKIKDSIPYFIIYF
jgi:hypothetical protein